MISLLHHQFVLYAFLAGTVTTVICAVIGYFVILRKGSFASHALSHIGFAGATGAALVGMSALVGTLLFTLLAAVGMGSLGEKIKGRDVEVGMILSFTLGLGVLFLKLYTANASEVVNILFGSLFSVTTADIYINTISSVVVLLLLLFLFRPLLFSSVDPEVAAARGVPVEFLSIVFMLLLAITVAQAILVIGILLVFALLIAPAATAQHIAHRPRTAIILSIILGLFFTWGGLLLALLINVPPSFFIAGLASMTYLIAVPLTHVISPHVYRLQMEKDRERE